MRSRGHFNEWKYHRRGQDISALVNDDVNRVWHILQRELYTRRGVVAAHTHSRVFVYAASEATTTTPPVRGHHEKSIFAQKVAENAQQPTADALGDKNLLDYRDEGLIFESADCFVFHGNMKSTLTTGKYQVFSLLPKENFLRDGNLILVIEATIQRF